MLSKKLQVFVSSTYTDLQAERQAAVEAILSAGHIPAGMELFAAGDQSQLQTILRWIDDSDIFLLILGGRYGSLDEESGKSYIHLEYRYALEQGKAMFAVVVDDEHLKVKARQVADPRAVIEQEYYKQWVAFRGMVLQRIVRFWSDPRDIKVAIMETLSVLERRDDLEGWVPASQGVNAAVLADEIARLSKENLTLREEVEELKGLKAEAGEMTYEETLDLLSSERDPISGLDEKSRLALRKVAESFSDNDASLLHVVWHLQDDILSGGTLGPDGPKNPNLRIFSRLADLGIVNLQREEVFSGGSQWSASVTERGNRFMRRFIIDNANDSRLELRRSNAGST